MSGDMLKSRHHLFSVLLIVFIMKTVLSFSEQGLRKSHVNEENSLAFFTKSLYNNSRVYVRITCSPRQTSRETKVRIGWVLRYSPCAEEYSGLTADSPILKEYFNHPKVQLISEFKYSYAEFKKSEKTQLYPCNKRVILLDNESKSNVFEGALVKANATSAATNVSMKSFTRRHLLEAYKPKLTSKQRYNDFVASQSAAAAVGIVSSVWRDGIYLFAIELKCDEGDSAASNSGCAFDSEIVIEMRADYGWLSAIEWPLLPFYGVMCIVYLFYGFLWFILCARYWRELLRIQFCIAAVIFLGMLEKAVFFAEYQSINGSGSSVRGGIILAELVSCMKRTFARVLVIVVALGYGIVKPRLGNDDRKVMAVAVFHFIFSAIESSIRSLRPRFEQSRNEFYASIPLAIIDAIICWWIFSALVQTTKNLRVRRNIVKLSLYRHFTNTLVFAVLASMAYLVWSVVQHKFVICIVAWHELWADTAFWHVLFSVLLLVIMVLWRPSKNNQRYAFSALLDNEEDADAAEDLLMENIADGIKSRAVSSHEERLTAKEDKLRRQGDEDLRWVEENIPSSMVDSALPSLLDSDEEIVTTRYQVNKME